MFCFFVSRERRRPTAVKRRRCNSIHPAARSLPNNATHRIPPSAVRRTTPGRTSHRPQSAPPFSLVTFFRCQKKVTYSPFLVLLLFLREKSGKRAAAKLRSGSVVAGPVCIPAVFFGYFLLLSKGSNVLAFSCLTSFPARKERQMCRCETEVRLRCRRTGLHPTRFLWLLSFAVKRK